MIFASSPGWNENGPMRIHTRAPPTFSPDAWEHREEHKQRESFANMKM